MGIDIVLYTLAIMPQKSSRLSTGCQLLIDNLSFSPKRLISSWPLSPTVTVSQVVTLKTITS